MVFFLVSGLILSAAGSFALWLALRGRDPRNRVETVGTLTRRQHFRNTQIRSRRVKDLTEYAYSYIADGKTYQISGTQWSHPKSCFRRPRSFT